MFIVEQHRERTRTVFGLVLFALLSSPWTHAASQEAEPVPSSKLLAISPISYIEHSRHEELRIRIQNALVKQALVHADDELEVMTIRQLSKEIEEAPNHAQSVEVARQWALLGIEKYKTLETKESIQKLARAIRAFQRARYQYRNPQEYADVLLYLALAYLEEGTDVAQPLKLFEEMIHLDQRRQLRAGFYPEKVVQFYQSAKQSVRESIAAGERREVEEDVGAATGADWVLSAHLIEEAESAWTLQVRLFDTQKKLFAMQQELSLTTLQPDHIDDAVSRLTSQVLSCLEEPSTPVEVVQESRGESAWSVDLSASYAAFLNFPEQKVTTFGNYGAQFGVRYLLSKEFALRLDLQILTSLRDYDGYLARDFSVLRGFLGGELGFDWNLFRLSSSIALEVASVGDIVLCLNETRIHRNNCSLKVLDQYGFLSGVNLGMRLAYQFLDSMDLGISVDGSLYLLPAIEESLNFPVSTEVGIQYRF